MGFVMGENVTRAYSVKRGEYEATGGGIIPGMCVLIHARPLVIYQSIADRERIAAVL